MMTKLGKIGIPFFDSTMYQEFPDVGEMIESSPWNQKDFYEYDRSNKICARICQQIFLF